ncbi:glycoside hydrolase [Stereum hirsutum FP-91666 SS1]|uniref:glycoside hydrolase n=1 Tax=Stereum hirsutum (strain FP-91666) TaxID=721885 RepID=UPI00044104AC|nr:glycoside hydrolase [Stereum hirsutum FP-91666 SS1]EIM88179.1 glycoside hydrolase [Stereum hirsutum FP-91666 SS1]
MPHNEVANRPSYKTYTQADWEVDISLASFHGFDGFALNVGSEDWQLDRVADCYATAEKLMQPDREAFKLFFSFDMASIPGHTADDVELLRKYVKRFASHACQMKYKGKVLISTFAGDQCRFGHDTMAEGWSYVLSVLKQITPIHFVPAFFIDPATYHSLSKLDGIFHWNGSWPLHLSPRSPPSDIHCPKLDSDDYHLANLGDRTYMAALSPWFFTHYGEDSWTKNWIYHSDDWLLVRRWEYILSRRSQIDIVQLLSWNDYGESHYMGPIHGSQPNSQAWVDGFPHTAWLTLNKHFIDAFKDSQRGRGNMPQVTEDKIWVWGRPHKRDSDARTDTVGRPAGWELTKDMFWVVILAKAPSDVALWSLSDSRGPHWVKVRQGVSKLSCPLVVGGGIHARMDRDEEQVAEIHTTDSDFCFTDRPNVYNFNVFVAEST